MRLDRTSATSITVAFFLSGFGRVVLWYSTYHIGIRRQRRFVNISRSAENRKQIAFLVVGLNLFIVAIIMPAKKSMHFRTFMLEFEVVV